MRRILATSLLITGVTQLSHAQIFGERPIVTPGKDTTRIVEPRDKEGYVDFVAAFNAIQREGVTVENNAALDVLRILDWNEEWDLYIPFLQELGLDSIRTAEPNYRSRKILEDASGRDYRNCLKSSWSAEDFPELARWLQENKQALNIFAEASYKKRNYTPIIAGVVETERGELDLGILSSRFPIHSRVRDLAQGLLIRANNEIELGNFEASWSDVRAAFQWSSHLSQIPFEITHILAQSVQRDAFVTTQQIALHPLCPARLRDRMSQEIDKLGDLLPITTVVDTGERWTYLDTFTAFGRNGFWTLKTINDFSQIPLDRDHRYVAIAWNDQSLERWISERGLDIWWYYTDWNQVLDEMNRYFDSTVAALSLPLGEERMDALKALERIDSRRIAMLFYSAERLREFEFAHQTDVIEGRLSMISFRWLYFDHFYALFVAPHKRRIASQHMCSFPASVLRFRYIHLSMRTALTDSYQSVTKATIALARYHNDVDQYPQTLEQLIPKYLDEPPVDFRTLKPFEYRTKGKSFTLISLGEDGVKDSPDGAITQDLDIVVRSNLSDE